MWVLNRPLSEYIFEGSLLIVGVIYVVVCNARVGNDYLEIYSKGNKSVVRESLINGAVVASIITVLDIIRGGLFKSGIVGIFIGFVFPFVGISLISFFYNEWIYMTYKRKKTEIDQKLDESEKEE